jgi:hypothetical protein
MTTGRINQGAARFDTRGHPARTPARLAHATRRRGDGPRTLAGRAPGLSALDGRRRRSAPTAYPPIAPRTPSPAPRPRTRERLARAIANRIRTDSSRHTCCVRSHEDSSHRPIKRAQTGLRAPRNARTAQGRARQASLTGAAFAAPRRLTRHAAAPVHIELETRKTLTRQSAESARGGRRGRGLGHSEAVAGRAPRRYPGGAVARILLSPANPGGAVA